MLNGFRDLGMNGNVSKHVENVHMPMKTSTYSMVN